MATSRSFSESSRLSPPSPRGGSRGGGSNGGRGSHRGLSLSLCGCADARPEAAALALALSRGGSNLRGELSLLAPLAAVEGSLLRAAALSWLREQTCARGLLEPRWIQWADALIQLIEGLGQQTSMPAATTTATPKAPTPPSADAARAPPPAPVTLSFGAGSANPAGGGGSESRYYSC